MKYLSPSDFGWARGLVDSSPSKGCAAFVYSILENRSTGRIIVDAVRSPQVAIVAANNTAYLFTESEFTSSKALHPFLMEYLQSGVSDEGVTLWATSPEQVAVLRTMFSLEARRVALSFPAVSESSGTLGNNPKNNGRGKEYSDGYRVETFVEKEGGRSEEESELEGTTCFGVRMIHADTIVSACYSDLFAGGEAEIQIRTHPDYRRKGLAFHVAQRFIEQTQTYNLRPAWSCDDDNIASRDLATRLGFIKDSYLYGYYLHPAFLTWRQDATGKLGPSPEVETTGFEEEGVVEAADVILHCLLEAYATYEANMVQEHPLQMLVLPQPQGIVARLIENNSGQVIRTFPLKRSAALTAQFKFRAGMHIDRQGFPQRGRFVATHGTTERIIRLAVYPSEYGEKMLLSVA